MKQRIALSICFVIVFSFFLLIGNDSVTAQFVQTATATKQAKNAVISKTNYTQLKRLACLTIPGTDPSLADVWRPIWSPNGQWIAAIGDTGVWVFAGNSLKEVPRFLPGQVGAILGFSRNSSHLITSDVDGKVISWDIATQKKQGSFKVEGVHDLLDPTGTVLAIVNSKEGLTLWETSSGHQVFSAGTIDYWPFTFSPDGSLLAGIDWKNATLNLYNVKNGSIANHLKRAELVNSARTLSFSSDGNILAIGLYNDLIWLWNIRSDNVNILPAQDYFDGIVGITFSPDSRNFISWGRSKMYLWDTVSGKLVAALTEHAIDSDDATFSPDGMLIATTDGRNRTRLWDAQTGEELLTIDGLSTYGWGMRSSTFSPDGTLLIGNNNELWGIGQPDGSCTN